MTAHIGLVGCGRIGRVHARAIAGTPGTRLRAVADVVDDAAKAIATEHDAEIRAVEDVIEAEDIDGVVVTTPTDTHADLIEAAARAGKPVFCEKPIDLSVARARSCLAAVEASGAALMVGFNRRFDPSFTELKARIDAGDVGSVEMLSIVSRDPEPPPPDYVRRSGGLFRDMTIHDLDMARFLLGEDPDTVLATGSILIDPEIGHLGDIDTASVILRTPSGRIVQIANSRRATYGYDQRIEVHGSRGMVSAGNVRATTVEVASATGHRLAPLLDFFLTRYARAYADEMAAFANLVENGGAASPSGHDGLLALVLAEAAGRSMVEGRAVPVDEIGEV